MNNLERRVENIEKRLGSVDDKVEVVVIGGKNLTMTKPEWHKYLEAKAARGCHVGSGNGITVIWPPELENL